MQWEPNFFMRKDGQTDKHDEANSRFSNFAEVPKEKQQRPSRSRPIFRKTLYKTSCQKSVCSMRKAGDELASSKYQNPIPLAA